MTLVNQEYFEFGDELLKKVSSEQTERKLSTKKVNVGGTKLEILEDTKLWDMFNDISNSKNNSLCKNDERKKLYNALLEKVLNARITQEFRRYQEKYIARNSRENRLGLMTRPELKSIGTSTEERENKKKRKQKVLSTNDFKTPTKKKSKGEE